eukprot:CFRG0110T1
MIDEDAFAGKNVVVRKEGNADNDGAVRIVAEVGDVGTHSMHGAVTHVVVGVADVTVAFDGVSVAVHDASAIVGMVGGILRVVHDSEMSDCVREVYVKKIQFVQGVDVVHAARVA